MTPPSAAYRRDREARTLRVAEQPGRHRVLTRTSLRRLGWTDRAIAHRVALGRWRSLFDGIVLVQSEPPGTRARIRAAWLVGGRAAVVSGAAAAYLHGLTTDAPGTIEIVVPHGRTPAPRRGIRFRRTRNEVLSRRIDGLLVAVIEEAVIDLVARAASPAEVVEWITRACARRLTTPGRLLAAAGRRRALPNRRLLVDTCGEVADGVMSPLERWHARDVVAAHGLPRGRRQVRTRLEGRTVYSDVEVTEFGVVTELDGRLGHEDERGRLRDITRDNLQAVRGRVTLRFGWMDAAGSACMAAEQTARVLSARGWAGRPRRCGPRCRLRWEQTA